MGEFADMGDMKIAQEEKSNGCSKEYTIIIIIDYAILQSLHLVPHTYMKSG